MAAKKIPKVVAPSPIIAAVVADAHVGNHARNGGPIEAGLNRRGRESVAVLESAVVAARDLGAPRFVVAGDLFHSRRPEPAVIRAVQDALDAAGQSMKVVLVPGNHDMLDATAARGNTAMAPLVDVADTIATEPCWSGPILLVPFHGTKPMSEFLGVVLEGQTRGPGKPKSFLVTHVGLYDEKGAAPWQRRARDGMSAEAMLLAMAGGNFCTSVVGNYHEHRHWSRKGITAIQAGTLCPASHGDGGLADRGLMILLREDGTWEKVEVPGPRFLTIVPGAAPPGEAPPGFSYYVRARGEGGIAVGAPPASLGWAALDWEPALSGEEMGDVARSDDETDEQAIAATVAELTLPDGVGRAAVEKLALEIWGRA